MRIEESLSEYARRNRISMRQARRLCDEQKVASFLLNGKTVVVTERPDEDPAKLAAERAELQHLRAINNPPAEPLVSVSPRIVIEHGLPKILEPAPEPLSDEQRAARLRAAVLEGSYIAQPVVVWPSNMRRGPNGELIWG